MSAEKENIELQPIFITIDPDRDTQEVVGKYVKEFSDRIIGLTGTMDEIKKVGQAFNVYFKAGPKDTADDYIVSLFSRKLFIYFLRLLYFINSRYPFSSTKNNNNNTNHRWITQ